jgi:hypothetical protein
MNVGQIFAMICLFPILLALIVWGLILLYFLGIGLTAL